MYISLMMLSVTGNACHVTTPVCTYPLYIYYIYLYSKYTVDQCGRYSVAELTSLF